MRGEQHLAEAQRLAHDATTSAYPDAPDVMLNAVCAIAHGLIALTSLLAEGQALIEPTGAAGPGPGLVRRRYEQWANAVDGS